MKKTISCIALLLAVVVCLSVFAACLPSSLDGAKKRMESSGYKLTSLTVSGDRAEGLVGAFKATDGTALKSDYVNIYYYESNSAAKKAYQILKESQEKDGIIVKCKGKCVYYGTETPIEDFENGVK